MSSHEELTAHIGCRIPHVRHIQYARNRSAIRRILSFEIDLKQGGSGRRSRVRGVDQDRLGSRSIEVPSTLDVDTGGVLRGERGVQ